MKRIEVSAGWHRGGRPGDRYGDRYVSAAVRMAGRWWRVGVFIGTPPGSHMGVWRTRVDDLRGVNVRIGRRYVGPCLTVLAHTRPLAQREP